MTDNELERLRGEVNSLRKESKDLKDGVTRLEGEIGGLKDVLEGSRSEWTCYRRKR